jgi:hypothetical protein
MKVTFAVHTHDRGTIDLVQSTVKGNKPSDAAWEEAAKLAMQELDAQTGRNLYGDDPAQHRWVNNYSISYVFKGWVEFEELAPSDLG